LGWTPPTFLTDWRLCTWQRPASSSTDINADKLAEFFVEKV